MCSMAFNHEEALGRLVTRYKKNSERVAALDGAIIEKRRTLETLCFELEHNIKDIELTDTGIRANHKFVPNDVFQDLLEELAERAVLAKEKQELGTCIRKAGLEGILR